MARALRIAFALLGVGIASAAMAQSEAIDKPVTIYVAGTAGGGIDLMARALSRHIGAHIPGKPTVTVQDMPGAGGIRAANFLSESAPKDGTAFTIFAGGPIAEPLIGARNPGYDMSKFNWIGAVTKDTPLCVSMASTPFRTLEDLRKSEMIVAGTGAGSETDTYPILLNEILHTRIKVITGYLGTKETILAMETGEVHGRCSFALSALNIARPDWLKTGKINVILNLGLEKSRAVPDAPLALDFVADTADRQLLELMAVTKQIALPFVAPPGVSAPRIAILRRAFDATMSDPAFIEEASRMGIDVDPSTGEAAQAVVEKLYATPKDVLARAKKLFAGN